MSGEKSNSPIQNNIGFFLESAGRNGEEIAELLDDIPRRWEKFDDIGDNNNKQIKKKIKHDNNNKILKKKSSSRQALFVSSHAIKDVQRLTKRVMHL